MAVSKGQRRARGSQPVSPGGRGASVSGAASTPGTFRADSQLCDVPARSHTCTPRTCEDTSVGPVPPRSQANSMRRSFPCRRVISPRGLAGLWSRKTQCKHVLACPGRRVLQCLALRFALCFSFRGQHTGWCGRGAGAGAAPHRHLPQPLCHWLEGPVSLSDRSSTAVPRLDDSERRVRWCFPRGI